jgi:uncharacterized protein YcbK (DUF882 family)
VTVRAAVAAAVLARFFVMGDGRLALVNAHTDARVDVQYRRADGTYDDVALAKIRRAFRSKGDEGDGEASLRLIEVLSYLQQSSGVRPLTLMSGYRSPDYNEGLIANGKRAASGSLHTEGLAADVAFPRKMLRPLWMKLRALDCCGAGYYAKEGFLHVDIGRPRFWEPQTSRVEEHLSAENARLFARTEFDRYAVGEPLVVTLHAMTLPPVRVERRVEVEGVHAELDGSDACVEVRELAGRVTVSPLDAPVRGRMVLRTCEPRVGQTPTTVETNTVEVR